MKPPGFLFFSDAESEFGLKADHSLLVGDPSALWASMGEGSRSFGQLFLATKSWSIKFPVAPESRSARVSAIFPKEPW